MIFALDIGNTNIVLGIIDTKTEEIVFTSRISSDHTKTVDEYAVLIQDVLAIRHVALPSITGSIISSVVPNFVTDHFVCCCTANRKRTDYGEQSNQN